MTWYFFKPFIHFHHGNLRETFHTLIYLILTKTVCFSLSMTS